MSKRPPDDDGNLKPIQTNIPADIQKEKTNELIETAAEQLADLLWKCWLVSNGPKAERRTKSNTRTDRARSS